MSVSLPLNQMTIEEKLEAMEILWQDLCNQADTVVAPDWHQEVLADRGADIEAHNDTFIDCDQAKQDIRNQLK